MDKKKFKQEHVAFIERFISIIETETPSYWIKIFDAPYSLIWGWKKGIFPSIEYVMKVCEISNVSPTWLFFGISPQFLDSIDKSHNEDKEKDKIQAFIWDLERRVKIEKELADIRIAKSETNQNAIKLLKWMRDTFDSDINEIEDIKLKDLGEKIVMPILEFFKANFDEVFLFITKCSTSEKNQLLLQEFIKWVRSNLK